jgi:hypothetical protein
MREARANFFGENGDFMKNFLSGLEKTEKNQL